MRSVSVIVPAFNEEELLGACIAALLAQDYPGPIEILVVDNASTDGTAEVIRRQGVNCIHEARRGYGNALIRGFAEAGGEILATTDADSLVPVDWVSRLVREYEADPNLVALGGEIDFTGPNLWGWFITRVMLPVLNRIDRMQPAGPHLWGANLSVRRDAFERAGGWNDAFSLQIDTELSERMRAQGRVALLESIVVRTSCRRWNRAPITSMALYAANFVAFHLLGRPVWRDFPAIREVAAQAVGLVARPVPGARAAVAALVALALATPVYEAFTPWSNAFGSTYWEGPANRRVVALTFDDGPEQPYTSEVLAILRREHVKATFFLVGENVRRFPDAAAEIARDGHAIGNHSDLHNRAFALQRPGLLRSDLDHAELTIHEVTGQWAHLFRPPSGIRSPWLMRVLAEDSLQTVTWDDAPGDWLRHTAPELVQSTVKQAHPGAIILLHDGLNLDHTARRDATVRALPGIIEALRADGYQFVTLPDLLRTPAVLAHWTPGEAGRSAPKVAARLK